MSRGFIGQYDNKFKVVLNPLRTVNRRGSNTKIRKPTSRRNTHCNAATCGPHSVSREGESPGRSNYRI